MPSVSIREVQAAYTEEKRKFNSAYLCWHFALEWIPPYLAVGAIRLGLSPNIVTVISTIIGVVGCGCIVLGGPTWMLTGLGLVLLWQILDDVDGHMARTCKRTSRLGAYLDEMGAHFVYAGLFFSLGIGLYIVPDTGMSWLAVNVENNTLFPFIIVIVGSLASISVTMRTVLAAKYYEQAKQKLINNNVSDSSKSTSASLGQLYRWLRQNFLELPGFLLVILGCSVTFGFGSVALLLYAFWIVADCLLAFGLHVRRLAREDYNDACA